jgi:hypothetical protein
MNSVNASTGFSPFQLRLSRSPCIIPPLVLDTLDTGTPTGIDAKMIISQISLDVEEAKDNLLQAKVFQSHYANQHHGKEPNYDIGNRVMLSMLHHRNKYKKKGEKCVAKFFPRFDGPYVVIDKHPETLTYTLELPTFFQHIMPPNSFLMS